MVYFERELTGPASDDEDVEPPPDLRLVDGRAVDSVALLELVPQIFGESISHYRANPLFDKDAALSGYQEWVSASLSGDRVVCIADALLRPLGFLTLTTAGQRAELLLGGVAAVARRRGGFTAAFTKAAQIARAAGCDSVVGPTHVANVGTQRAFFAAGFRPVAATTTVHAVRPGLLSRDRE